MADNSAISIAKIASEITHQELVEQIKIIQYPSLMSIKQDIIDFMENAKTYLKEVNIAKRSGNVETLKRFIDILYGKFFQIQNKLNAYLGQKIVLTYVHINSDGSREIRVSENDTSHLIAGKYSTPWGQEFVRYSYEVNDHYQLLKNSLPEKDNEGLNETAAEVSARRKNNKSHIVFWERKNKQRKYVGYKLGTEGPINEAFVNFYVHDVKFKKSLNIEQRVGRFMLDSQFGAIKADNTKGYFIGDVARDGIQYAVKGAWGGPQGIAQIIKEFEKLIKANFSLESFYAFVDKYTTQELEKNYTPHAKKVTEQEIEKLIGMIKT